MPSFSFREISSPAVLAAERRRIDRAVADNTRDEWFIEKVCKKVNISMGNRTRIATEHVRTKVVYNISRPVTKALITSTATTGTRYYTSITNRSRPGEFPKADTTLLMKSIFTDVKNPQPGVFDGYVGTPVDYALRLELKMNRSFLRRTLFEEKSKIIQILAGPLQEFEEI